MKNSVFFIGSLQLGGTEAKLARNFLPQLKARQNLNPKLLLLQERGEFLSIVSKEIETLSLEETSNTNLINILPRFRDALKRLNADVVISCMWYPAIVSYFAKKFLGADFKHIVHDTVNMTEYIKDHFINERFKGLKLYLIKKAYKDADAIIVVSYGEKDDLVENFDIPSKKIHTIYNPLNAQLISQMASDDYGLEIKSPLIVSTGRLVYQKGFDILLRAFKKVREQIQCRLLIIGDGEKKDELCELAKSLNISNDVIWAGFQINPYKIMKLADVFCLASRYEGLANVILEAMVLGIPVVAADCPSGPSEILDNGRYGSLVPPESPDAIADAILKVLTDKELKQKMSMLSKARAQDFGFETTLKKWEGVILDE